MRYVVYDRNSGSILHTHEFYKLGNEEPQEVGEDDLRAVVSRFHETDKVGIAGTTLPPVSSRHGQMLVDTTTGNVVMRRSTPDTFSSELRKIHEPTAEKKREN